MTKKGLSTLSALVIILLAFSGCKGKQEQPKSGTAIEEKTATSPAATSGNKAENPPDSPDMADARSCALRVLSQLKSGEFANVYRESGTPFKQIGSEIAFVSRFQQTYQKTGALGNPQELKSETRHGNVIVLIYRVENQRFVTDMRLSFARAKNGAMELIGLNQHDEPKTVKQ